jgi:UDP-N-acetylglucosamine 3-dehydrogenase
MVNIGLIGLGAITRSHLHAFVEGGIVGAVKAYDPSEEARQQAAAEFGIIKQTYDSIDPLLEDDSLAIIDICTPHYLHKPQAVAALRAGKHVILEKPMALTVEECDEITRAAVEAGRRVFVALCQRSFPAHVKAKELMDEGAIGRPFLGVINVYGNELTRMLDPASWKGDWEKAGGGALFDTGYHAVYMLQHFFGPATAITAMARRLLVEAENKADDVSVAALELPGPALGSIVVTYGATGDRWTEERRIVGTNGSLFIRDDAEDGAPLVLLRGDQVEPIKVATPLFTHPYGIARTLDHFLDCIINDKPETITTAEARAAVATCQAAYVSERQGKRVEIGA